MPKRLADLRSAKGYYAKHKNDTVNVRPEMAASEAVLSLPLTVSGLGITCLNAHGQLSLLPPHALRWLGLVPGPDPRPLTL